MVRMNTKRTYAKRFTPKSKHTGARKPGSAVLKSRKSSARYHLKSLLKGVSKKSAHPRIDFGPPVGCELL